MYVLLLKKTIAVILYVTIAVILYDTVQYRIACFFDELALRDFEKKELQLQKEIHIPSRVQKYFQDKKH
jgi:hypothetical protein